MGLSLFFATSLLYPLVFFISTETYRKTQFPSFLFPKHAMTIGLLYLEIQIWISVSMRGQNEREG